MIDHAVANIQGMIFGSLFAALLVAASPKKFQRDFLDALHWAVGVWDAQWQEIVEYWESKR